MGFSDELKPLGVACSFNPFNPLLESADSAPHLSL
jgi:hypothetical protein